MARPTNYYVLFVPDYQVNSNEKDLPMVSFAIPTYNCDKNLEQCLKSIEIQEYPCFEIVIVDGYSNDRTIEIAEKYADRIVFCKGTLGECRQLSIKCSSGEIIALFDSDIIVPHEKWLIKAVKKFQYDKRISTVWPINISPPISGKLSKVYVSHSWSTMLEMAKKGRGIWGGGNSLFKAKLVKEAGGIDPQFHEFEDFYLARKLKDRGYKVIFHEDPLYHVTHATFEELIRKELSRAKHFKDYNMISLTELSRADWIYAHLVNGIKNMIRGLFIEKDRSWALLPLVLAVRAFAYLTQ